jgi:hypothetical protein
MSDEQQRENGRHFTALSRFLIFCSGADKSLLAHCPNSDVVKIQGIGGVVAATGLLAFLSGSYAFWTVFGPSEELMGGGAPAAGAMSGLVALGAIGALVFGLIWSLVIFNLDRFIVAASGPGDGKDTISFAEFRTALPRLIMAVLIGIVLAAPLEIRVMKSEIDAALTLAQLDKVQELNARTDAKLKNESDRFDAELARVSAAVAARESKVTALEQQREDVQNKLAVEIGSGGTGRVKGDGPVAAALRASLRDVESRLEQARAEVKPQVEGLERERVSLQGRKDKMEVKREVEYEINRKNAGRDNGLMRRIELAHEVSPTASNLLMLLLIVIEVAPIIFKLMLIAGPYEYFTESEKRLALARRGIDVTGALRPGADGRPGELREVKMARYAEAEAIASRELGKWRVEAHLTDIALATHQQRLETDISAYPERYVEQQWTTNEP